MPPIPMPSRCRRAAGRGAAEVENLEAGYGEVQVLWGLSLKARRGALTAIVGANGAGKTTTLRAVAGSIAPWRGKVTFEGEDVTHLPSHAKAARGFALVPEGRQLFSSMSVAENLEMGAFSKRAASKYADRLDQGLHAVPAARRAQAPARRHAVGRRAADGGDRARADVRSRHSHHRRTLARPCAGRRLSVAWRRSSS